jgi:hypothetical protein
VDGLLRVAERREQQRALGRRGDAVARLLGDRELEPAGRVDVDLVERPQPSVEGADRVERVADVEGASPCLCSVVTSRCQSERRSSITGWEP